MPFKDTRSKVERNQLRTQMAAIARCTTGWLNNDNGYKKPEIVFNKIIEIIDDETIGLGLHCSDCNYSEDEECLSTERKSFGGIEGELSTMLGVHKCRFFVYEGGRLRPHLRPSRRRLQPHRSELPQLPGASGRGRGF